MNSDSLPQGWVETSLGNVITLVGGGTPRTSIFSYWNGEIPWLSVVDFNNNNRWVSTTEKSITEEGLDNSSTKLLSKDDLIISARGTVGALAQLQKIMAFNQSCYGIKEKTDISDINFLYYLIKFNLIVIGKHVHGAVFDTITRQTFDNIQINLPSIPEQKAIANFLSSFDEKIELLREQNKTLEILAQTIFREWFVAFNYPGATGEMVDSELGKIPKGWDIQSIYDSANYTNGAAFKQEDFKEFGVPIIKIVELKNGITTQTKYTTKIKHNKYLIDDENILFSWSGSPETSIDIFLWSSGKAILNQHTYKVLQKNDIDKFWLFFQLKELKPFFVHLAKQKQTTGLGHVTITDLKNNYICKPPIEIISQFNLIGENIFQKLFANKKQISNLFKLQDILLPKLMKGEVRMEGFE